MNCYSWDSLYIGLQEQFVVEIMEKTISAFGTITGDINPLHNDLEYAKLKGYKDKVAYGMLTASFLSTLAGVYLPGEKSLIHSVELKFVKPVYVGDSLRVIGTVTELNNTVRQIVLKVEIVNQQNIKVLRGTMKVGMLE